MSETDPRAGPRMGTSERDTSRPVEGPAGEGACADPVAPVSPTALPHRRWRPGLLLVLLAVAIGLALGNFIQFAHRVATLSRDDPPAAAPGADAIVVLTGGSERVKVALNLLAEGRAKRLLISGVHPDTTPRQIVSTTESDMALFSCCVDLDRIASNTLQNAEETAKWVHDNGYARVLIVTSAYHMPRALLELRSVAGDVDLLPVAVQANGMELDRWYLDPAVSLLLLREHMKYMLTWLRIAAATGRMPG